MNWFDLLPTLKTGLIVQRLHDE